MTTTAGAVQDATAADLGTVVSVLTDAFHEDPMMCWAYPDDELRPRRLGALWGFLAERVYLPAGASTTATPIGSGAALWGPPQMWGLPEEGRQEAFWATNGPDFATALEGDLERMSLLAAAMRESRPSEPHWYLLALGVRRDLHGRGIGGRLLAQTLTRIDREGDGAYLEASSPRNRVLYERFGFQVTAEIRVEDSPPIWGMWRAPRSRR